MGTKLLILVGFLVAFAAGLVVGVQKGRSLSLATPGAPNEPTTRPTTRTSRHGGMLAKELNLTPEQQEQLNQIWSETLRRGGHERDEQRRQYRSERDAALE